jgi:hypothetical protein
MPLRISRAAALTVGIVLPIIETWRRWHMLADWPSWIDDYIAAGLLLYAWQAGRDELSRSHPYLMAAWGYTVGIAYMSFFGQLKNATGADPSGMPLIVVFGFKGLGLGIAITCLGLSWRTPAPGRNLGTGKAIHSRQPLQQP